MTSERKIAANRENAKKSTGPRTSVGKARAGRNALRHGLESANFGDSGASEKVARIAKAICNGDIHPLRYEQAIVIAECQVLVARVQAARLAAIERKRVEEGREAAPPFEATREANESAPEVRDEVECLCLALPDLLRLERYERRALSRRRRAIRTLKKLRK